MKTSTLNGDLAIATAALAQFYDSFASDNDTALTAFDYAIEQTLFENLEAEFGAHVFASSNQVIWSDGTDTITLSTDATLSADDTQRSAQIPKPLKTVHLTTPAVHQSNLRIPKAQTPSTKYKDWRV